MQNAVSSENQSMTDFHVANAQKQEAIGAECTEASSAPMFQELMQNAELSATAEESLSDGKAHLTSSVPRAARVPRGALSKSEMTELRELFGGLSDADIQRLYKRVTK